MRPELILWDWNGTLLDDVELCVDALNRLLVSFGYPQQYSLAEYREIFGFPIEDYYVRAGFDFSKDSFARSGQAVYGGLHPPALPPVRWRPARVKRSALSATPGCVR